MSRALLPAPGLQAAAGAAGPPRWVRGEPAVGDSLAGSPGAETSPERTKVTARSRCAPRSRSGHAAVRFLRPGGLGVVDLVALRGVPHGRLVDLAAPRECRQDGDDDVLRVDPEVAPGGRP